MLKGGKGSFLNRSEEIFLREKPYANFQIILVYDISTKKEKWNGYRWFRNGGA